MNPLLDFLLRSSLLVGTAWLAAILTDRVGGSAAMRHRIWLLALAALLALPVLAVLLPPLPLDNPARSRSGAGGRRTRRDRTAMTCPFSSFFILWLQQRSRRGWCSAGARSTGCGAGPRPPSIPTGSGSWPSFRPLSA
jgi:hypothetical protein